MKSYEKSLGDKELDTIFIEAKTVVNSRPKTTEMINDSKSFFPLSQRNLLKIKSKVIRPTPGTFSTEDDTVKSDGGICKK